ncbi:MAG: hypothetical protein EWV91_11600, partial [Microcystis aeruginosa Ma_QC_Ca_00000000_S207]
ICALSVSLYRFQLLLGVGTLIEFYFKLIICITITEEPDIFSGAIIPWISPLLDVLCRVDGCTLLAAHE